MKGEGFEALANAASVKNIPVQKIFQVLQFRLVGVYIGSGI